MPPHFFALIMLIVMLETLRGSEDGFLVRCFEKGHCYEVANLLACAFINAGWAKRSTSFCEENLCTSTS